MTQTSAPHQPPINLTFTIPPVPPPCTQTLTFLSTYLASTPLAHPNTTLHQNHQYSYCNHLNLHTHTNAPPNSPVSHTNIKPNLHKPTNLLSVYIQATIHIKAILTQPVTLACIKTPPTYKYIPHYPKLTNTRSKPINLLHNSNLQL